MEPPDPFPNSEVKRLSADGSVVRPCESRSSSAPYFKPLFAEAKGGFCLGVGYYCLIVTKVLLNITQTFFIISFQNFILYYNIVLLFAILGL